MTDDRLLATDYLLGELDAAGRAEAEHRLATDPAFRARVHELAPIVGHLDELPAQAWPPGSNSADALDAHRRRAPRWAPLAAVGVVLLAVGLGAGWLARGPGDGPAAPRAAAPAPARAPVSLVALPGTARTARAEAVVTQAGAMVLDVHGLRPAPPRHFYELWLMSDAKRLVAVASFRVHADGTAHLTVPLPADPRRYRYLDVSVQAAAAGPAHSGTSVLRSI